MKEKTECEITAAKYHALQTKYHATKILHTEADNKGRRGHQYDDTTDHLISACQYWQKNNSVFNYTLPYASEYE
jgi:hypothetical protein